MCGRLTAERAATNSCILRVHSMSQSRLCVAGRLVWALASETHFAAACFVFAAAVSGPASRLPELEYAPRMAACLGSELCESVKRGVPLLMSNGLTKASATPRASKPATTWFCTRMLNDNAWLNGPGEAR
jgi:hypothetical protein